MGIAAIYPASSAGLADGLQPRTSSRLHRFIMDPDQIRDPVSARAMAASLRALADQFEARADQIDRRHRNARFSIADYRTIVRASKAAHIAMLELGRDEAAAVRWAAVHYDIPEHCIRAHLDEIKRRHTRDEIAAKEKAARGMTRRGLSQREVAARLGVTQPRVSQLVRRATSAAAAAPLDRPA